MVLILLKRDHQISNGAELSWVSMGLRPKTSRLRIKKYSMVSRPKEFVRCGSGPSSKRSDIKRRVKEINSNRPSRPTASLEQFLIVPSVPKESGVNSRLRLVKVRVRIKSKSPKERKENYS